MKLPTPKPAKQTMQSFTRRLGDKPALAYDDFIDWALYDPEAGYYQSDRVRVGRQPGSDFYTSGKMGRLWGELIVSSCEQILGRDNLSSFTFVEIAAEPQTSTLSEIDHPFAEVQIIRLNSPLQIPPHSIVFCNEWLDAQPFRRFQYSAQEQSWQELGVRIEGDFLIETVLDAPQDLPEIFPDQSKDGYIIDWPSGSIHSLQSLVHLAWGGLFLTFDYGLPLTTLLNDRPEGTARGYWRHQMVTDLLARPGEQDITCHLCWDVLSETLNSGGFDQVQIQTQESFLLNFANQRIKKIFEQKKDGLHEEMQALRELIHPAHLGHGIQALWGRRKSPSRSQG
jgi:SAM-dependent MidA family methyltransferase